MRLTEYVEGRSAREIAKALNRDGIPPPRGRAWNAGAITGSRARGSGILRNELYRGRLVWNRVRMVRDPEAGRRVSRENPESEWQRADVAEPSSTPRHSPRPPRDSRREGVRM